MEEHIKEIFGDTIRTPNEKKFYWQKITNEKVQMANKYTEDEKSPGPA